MVFPLDPTAMVFEIFISRSTSCFSKQKTLLTFQQTLQFVILFARHSEISEICSE